MKNETQKQIEFLKKYGVKNYTLDGDKISINGSLYLSSLTSIPDSEFLKNTSINGSLDLSSLTSIEKETTRNNIKTIKQGYNKKINSCYFDGILSKVISVKERNGITIFKTQFNYIAKKGKYTAHGKTVKQSISDLDFKIVSKKLKNEPIMSDTKITVKHYRLITGACDEGVRSWMQANSIPFKIVDERTVEVKPILASELLTILENTNAYGLSKFKSLIKF